MTQTAPEPVKDDAATATSEGAGKPDAASKEGTSPRAQAKKAVKKAAAKKPSPKANLTVLTVAQATQQAVKDNVASMVGHLFVMPITHIARYDNPRHEPEHLHELGYTLFGDPKIAEPNLDEKEKQYVSLSHMAMSEDMVAVQKYVDLIEEHEGPVMRLLNPHGKPVFQGSETQCKAKLKDQTDKSGWKIDNHPSAPQSIVELAQDLYLYTQLDPIEVRHNGTKTSMIDGGRRVAAILYLHAKSRVCRANKAEAEIFGEGVPKEYPAVVQATDLKAAGDDFLLACKINLSRKQFTPLQEGRVYHDMLKKLNPTTGKNYTMKEAAADLGVEYGTFRNREALWREPEFTENGERTKGLTEPERRKVALGEMTTTAASRKALGERHFSQTGQPAHNRNRGLPLSEMQRLFDETAEANKERRQAIADCMGMTLRDAIKESERRVEETDRKALNSQPRGRGKKNKKKAA